jgi:hypothetical protein
LSDVTVDDRADGHGNTMTRSDDCVDLAHDRLSGGLRLDRDQQRR